jgi:hypothetical protein
MGKQADIAIGNDGCNIYLINKGELFLGNLQLDIGNMI